MVQCSIPLIVQFCAILAGIFGVVAAFLIIFNNPSGFNDWIRGLYALFFCLTLIELEFYVFGFHKYFGFLLKSWGKGLMYLFVGALLFATSGYGLWCSIVYWAVAVVFGIVAIFVPIASRPLLQGGLSGEPSNLDLGLKSSDIFKTEAA
jgi:hypothetical protein